MLVDSCEDELPCREKRVIELRLLQVPLLYIDMGWIGRIAPLYKDPTHGPDRIAYLVEADAELHDRSQCRKDPDAARSQVGAAIARPLSRGYDTTFEDDRAPPPSLAPPNNARDLPRVDLDVDHANLAWSAVRG